MKKLSFLFILSILFSSFTLIAQYGYDDEFYDNDSYPGYLGDNFSLEGALETFKNSRSVEDFENRINYRDNYVNNLDLNNDGRTDFIRVSDESENRNYRLLVMQAVLGRKDVQDIAVIAIEKTGNRRATLQIIGDEYLFGPDMILEPNDLAYNQDRRGYGPSGDIEIIRGFINVYYWPSVRSLFRSRYSYYRSPYYWDNYPRVWNPWRPYYYNTYYDRCSRFRRGYYRPARGLTILYVNNYYRPRRRSYSPYIRDRYNRCVVVYNRDSQRNGNRRRNISQTPPQRRQDFDRRKGIRDDERLRGGTYGSNGSRNSNRIERSRNEVNVGRNVERGGYFGNKTETAKPNKRGEYGTAPSRNDRSISKRDKSNSSIDRVTNRTSTKPSRGSTYNGNRKATPKKSDRYSTFGNDKRSSTKPSKSSPSYRGDRRSSTKPSRGSSSNKSDKRSSTVKPNRSTSKKSSRSGSYKSDRKSTSKPSRSSSTKSSRSSSTKPSNRSSNSRKSSSVKSAPKRSTPKASSRSSKPSKSYKSSRRSTKSTSSKSSRSSKRGN